GAARRCASVGNFLAAHWLFAVDHPWDAELVDEHAKARRPEGFLNRHFHGAAFRKGLENTVRLFWRFDLQRYGKAARLFVIIARVESSRRAGSLRSSPWRRSGKTRRAAPWSRQRAHR